MDEGKRTFSIESAELLEDIESSLLVLESAPRNAEAVNSLFRAVHTLKGSAGIIGLDRVEEFAHTVESVLDRVRRGEVQVTGSLIGLLLECRDHMAGLIGPSLHDVPLEAFVVAEGRLLEEKLEAYLERPVQSPSAPVPEQAEGPSVESDTWHISLRFGPDVMRNGMDPISFINYLTRLGDIVSITTLLDTLPSFEDLDPESCYLGFEIDLRSDFDKESIEDVFEFVADDCTVRILPPRSRVEQYIALISDLPENAMRLGEILVQGGALTEAELQEALKSQNADEKRKNRNIGEILVEEGMVDPSVLDAAISKQKNIELSRETSSIRVDTGKLDQLINLVGEIVIAGANIDQNARRVRDRDLHQSTFTLLRLIDEMRERAMSIRMMPVHDTFHRFHRVVRDLAHERGKQVALEIQGGETELDKTVLERIKDPLMHLVRNAVDHGIETTDERSELGKPQEGAIRLNAYQDTGEVIIQVSDDGRGLDNERILKKAIASGIVDEGQDVSDAEIEALIFAPGFSTAGEITSISGRGVGMDVVKSNIEALHGSLDIESRQGAGTTVTIRLPLTLAIIDGFMVRVADAAYVIPMNTVVECLELTSDLRSAAHGRHFVKLREGVLPYIRLREMFAINGETPEHEHILVVRHGERQVGVLVDELHGGIQAVIKPLGRMYRDVRGISAATILGDGTVALILDVAQLAEVALELEARYNSKGRG